MYLIAKQAANQIEEVDDKSKAYCAIATEQAKTSPEDAKQTSDHIQSCYWKSRAYCAIAAALLLR